MTAPAQGHADFQTYAQNLGTTTYIASATYTTNQPSVFSGAIANFCSLLVNVGCTGGGANIVVTYYADAAFTQSLTQDEYSILNLATLNVALPIRGPYVRIALQMSALNTVTCRMAFTPSNVPVLAPTHMSQGIEWSEVNRSIAAGGSDTLTMPFVMQGKASVLFRPADSTGKLDFYYRSITSANVYNDVLENFLAPTTVQRSSFYVPWQPQGIQVINNDGAAAHNYYVTVIVIPV